jgi:hypothetical protein
MVPKFLIRILTGETPFDGGTGAIALLPSGPSLE